MMTVTVVSALRLLIAATVSATAQPGLQQPPQPGGHETWTPSGQQQQQQQQQQSWNRPPHPHPPGAVNHAQPPTGFMAPHPPGVSRPPPPPPPLPPRPVASGYLETLMAESSGEFEADGYLEVVNEFKLEVGGGREECMFQKVRPNSRFYVAFKVLSGSELNVDVIVRGPDTGIVDQHVWARDGTTDRFIAQPGGYSVCISNMRSRFSAKLVHFFLATYVVDDLRRYGEDLEQFDVSVTNVTGSLQKVSDDVGEMRLKQLWSRQQSVGDYYTIRANYDGVLRSAVALCGVILMTSLLQVAFLRRLFDAGGSSSKRVKP